MPHVSKVLKAKWEKQKSFSPKAIWHELRERKENDSTGEKQKQEYMGKIGRWIGKRVFFVCLLFFIKGKLCLQLFHIFRNFLSKWQGNPQVTALADFTLNLDSKTQSSHLINVQRLYKWIFLIRIKKKTNKYRNWLIYPTTQHIQQSAFNTVHVCVYGRIQVNITHRATSNNNRPNREEKTANIGSSGQKSVSL